jgi:poly-gamma-glutamate capsule biosynthesis protein CapA/YwtB (metallophosphatase superfamily)
MAREIFGKGANLIVGAGPHVLQKVEPWGSGVVAWSLGNLVFDGAGPGPDWRRGGLLTVTIDPRDGKILRHELREIQVSGPVPGPIYQIKR